MSNSKMPPDVVKRVLAFKTEYQALCAKYHISIGSCGCCGGLHIKDFKEHPESYSEYEYLEGAHDPNGWVTL